MVKKFWEGVLFGLGAPIGFLLCIMALQLSGWILKHFGILLN
jgi:hypothetical protein